MFCPVQYRIDSGYQGKQFLSGVVLCHAAAQSDTNILATKDHSLLLDRLANGLGALRSLLGSAAVQQQEKLFTSPAAQRVRCTSVLSDHVCHGTNDHITGLVPER